MNDHAKGPMSCEGFQEDLTAIALDSLSGRRRSEVLSHVESCQRCAIELEQLSMVADAVLHLAPEEDPPVGFELRLAQRLQAGATQQRSHRFSRAHYLVAAALIVAIGFGVGALVGSHSAKNASQSTANLASATLSSRGRAVGEVFVSGGKPSWMFMAIDSPSWSGEVTCQLILANGSAETVGSFELSDGYGSWGAPLTSSAGRVRGARLITVGGAVVASASFRT
jgi:hypothetical protein